MGRAAELNNKPEILSPAGDRECLEAAVDFGCDAVYVGGQTFGMRAGPKNFDMQGLADAVKYAHNGGSKLYLTCNTVPTNDEAEAYPKFIAEAYDAGIDAAIIADIGVMAMTKKHAPGLDIHMSTQVGIMNYTTANELYRLGAKRIVLAREVPLRDIAVIRRNIPEDMEIEVFVHGAMCVSFSGRCLLSKYMTGRDANRGQCAQPCRWNYHLIEEQRPGVSYDITEDERGTYILNAKDLCMIDHLDDLIDAGVSSMKIEGRAKSAYYTATMTNAYKKALGYALDGKKVPESIVNEVYRVSHRPYCTGFFYDHDNAEQYYPDSQYCRDYEFAGIIDGYENGRLLITLRNYFTLDQELEVLPPKGEPVVFTPSEMFDKNEEPVRAANRAMDRYYIPYGSAFPPKSIIRAKNNR
ncbi:MAG: U32 family peptidase [Ruminiclostridium sp.]|nr:U32 family peptidase [Ruminiclostridium sp.]